MFVLEILSSYGMLWNQNLENSAQFLKPMNRNHNLLIVFRSILKFDENLFVYFWNLFLDLIDPKLTRICLKNTVFFKFRGLNLTKIKSFNKNRKNFSVIPGLAFWFWLGPHGVSNFQSMREKKLINYYFEGIWVGRVKTLFN